MATKKKSKKTVSKTPKAVRPSSKKTPPVVKTRVRRHTDTTHLRRIMQSHLFSRAYAAGALTVLVFTTLYWALLGAWLQADNADQLVDPYLFANHTTFQQAIFPGQHTFLLKWPLFWAVQLFGASNAVYAWFTVGVVLLTVGMLVVLLYRLERRLLVFGTICLALASVLLLVPAQPSAGTLLPVNMAMLATRNLEYVLYLAAVVGLVRAPRMKSWQFIIAGSALVLLFATDKLFTSISLGGAIIMFFVYTVRRQPQMAKTALRWIVAGGVAGIAALLVAGALNALHITHIASQAGPAPYGAIHGLRELALGLIYGVLGIFTNMGANPAYDATTLREIPHQLRVHLLSAGGVSYVVNIVIVALALAMAGRVWWLSLRPKTSVAVADKRTQFSLILLWSLFAALAVFVVSSHYYVADARYLGLVPFALFIAVATFTSRRQWPPEKVVVVGLGLLVSIVLGIAVATQSYWADKTAASTIADRNSLVAQAIMGHKVGVLVGDYWRVMPIRQLTQNTQQVMPLATCTTGRDVLTSRAWQPNLRHQSFAFLLSTDKGMTDFPACTLGQVLRQYGRPNASVVIAGNIEHPREVLLFYDRGAQRPISGSQLDISKLLNTVTPVPLQKLAHTQCSGRRIMNIVAHQDDDLLFMNPDIQDGIAAGDCVRSVYVTAGDAGNGRLYWLGREQGTKAAYDYMKGPNKETWVDQIVKLSSKEYATVSSPARDSRLSLIFLHLPDGNITGSGFAASHHQSLEQLEGGTLARIQSVDGQSAYSSDELSAALTALMDEYEPSVVRTTAPFNMSDVYPDHSDHMAVGRYVQKAFENYKDHDSAMVNYYIGYPIHALDANVSDGALTKKRAVFFRYAQYDGGVCDSLERCKKTPTYAAYLERQYQVHE